MQTLKISAVFIGENYSCGFIHGQHYELTGYLTDKGVIQVVHEALDIPQPLRCIYQSLKAFLRDWANVSELPEAAQNLNKPNPIQQFDTHTNDVEAGLVIVKKIQDAIAIAKNNKSKELHIKVNRKFPEYILDAILATIETIEGISGINFNYETQKIRLTFRT